MRLSRGGILRKGVLKGIGAVKIPKDKLNIEPITSKTDVEFLYFGFSFKVYFYI